MKQYDASQHPDVTAGTRTAASVFKEFLDTFDGGDQHGAVTPDEFLAYYTGVGENDANCVPWFLNTQPRVCCGWLMLL
jgi:hypothetical protein